jgi:hypothetical protein
MQALRNSLHKHLQWRIDESMLIQNSVSILTLSGSEQFPILKIEFEDVAIEEVDHLLVDKINPRWAEPGAGLARPSIERLNEILKGNGEGMK